MTCKQILLSPEPLCHSWHETVVPMHGVGLGFRVLGPEIQTAHLHEGRHGIVDLGRLPDGALLSLEAEGRQRPVVCAALGDAAGEQIRRVRLQTHRQLSACAGRCGGAPLCSAESGGTASC